MAIMQSCCCWRSVRRGSFACAIYTGIYFALIAMSTSTVLQDEHLYLSGNTSMPKSITFLEPETVSPVTIRFNMTLLVCSCFGVISCILLLYGLFRDQRVFLLPWIANVITCSIVDVAHSLYLFCFVPFHVNPITALVYTLDFFLLCLNVYSLLCVISQYQEYIHGRGTAIDDCEHRIPAIRYTVQPTTTATSCLSSRRPGTTTTIDPNETNETKTNALPTPTQSPIVYRTILSCDKNSSGTRPARKHVQFPDTPSSSQNRRSAEMEIGGWTLENENLIVNPEITFSLLQPPSTTFTPKQANNR